MKNYRILYFFFLPAVKIFFLSSRICWNASLVFFPPSHSIDFVNSMMLSETCTEALQKFLPRLKRSRTEVLCSCEVVPISITFCCRLLAEKTDEPIAVPCTLSLTNTPGGIRNNNKENSSSPGKSTSQRRTRGDSTSFNLPRPCNCRQRKGYLPCGLFRVWDIFKRSKTVCMRYLSRTTTIRTSTLIRCIHVVDSVARQGASTWLQCVLVSPQHSAWRRTR